MRRSPAAFLLFNPLQGCGVRVVLGQPPAAAAPWSAQPLCHAEPHPPTRGCARAAENAVGPGRALVGCEHVSVPPAWYQFFFFCLLSPRPALPLTCPPPASLRICFCCKAEDKVHRRLSLAHPVFSFASDKAQRALPAAQVGGRRVVRV